MKISRYFVVAAEAAEVMYGSLAIGLYWLHPALQELFSQVDKQGTEFSHNYAKFAESIVQKLPSGTDCARAAIMVGCIGLTEVIGTRLWSAYSKRKGRRKQELTSGFQYNQQAL